MTNPIQILPVERTRSCVVALHCSLGSGRQWTRLAAELGSDHEVIAPDLSGYGNNPGPFDLPTTLAQEVELLAGCLYDANGPIHLVGHSYGGALAFKIATRSPFASRVRSLTLIEPVLPTLLRDSATDRRLYDRFVRVAHDVYADLWKGLALEAIDKFTDFWNGSGPAEQLSPNARVRMIEHADKVAFDFASVLAEENVEAVAANLRVPTLLVSGGLSPYLTQRIVGRLALIIEGAEIRHLRGAGHMLPITHAPAVNPWIRRHIARADELAGLTLASGQTAAALPQLDWRDALLQNPETGTVTSRQ
jgi:pimeloyl-ACP methyl ester carboxylesterase